MCKSESFRLLSKWSRAKWSPNQEARRNGIRGNRRCTLRQFHGGSPGTRLGRTVRLMLSASESREQISGDSDIALTPAERFEATIDQEKRFDIEQSVCRVNSLAIMIFDVQDFVHSKFKLFTSIVGLVLNSYY